MSIETDYEGRQPSVALLFDKFGPYHTARLKAARKLLNVTGVEMSPYSSDYPWFESEDSSYLIRCFSYPQTMNIRLADRKRELTRCLDEIDADVVAIPGWSDAGALIALQWCATRERSAVIMSDSTYIDARRFWIIEQIKVILLNGYSAGFVSGERSKEYLSSLCIPQEYIATGYDVVDNEYFLKGADAARTNSESERARLGLPARYLLYVGRLVNKKNVSNLLRAFAIYCERVGPENALVLLIVGNGALSSTLKAQAAELNIARYVYFHGHADYADLPSIYGLARFFVLPSVVEQWGLVVNEAIACGLPVLVSCRSGASADLVDIGQNGFVFDPTDIVDLSNKIEHLAYRVDISGFELRSKQISRNWDLDRFASGLQLSVRRALDRKRPSRRFSRWLAGLLLLGKQDYI